MINSVYTSGSISGTSMEYLAAYRQVLATKESIEMWFIKVILLGAPRLGKTTARRRLTGEIINISSSGEGEQPSTGAVESAPSIVIRHIESTPCKSVIRHVRRNTALVTPTEWLPITDLSEEARLFLQFFYHHVQDQQGDKIIPLKNQVKSSNTDNTTTHVKAPVSSPKKRKKKSKQLTSIKSNSASSSPTSSTSVSSEHSQPQALSDVADLFRKAVGPKYWKDIKHLFTDTAFIKMEDTGGQPEFMDMLPALTIGPALYLLFCKLIDRLKSHYMISYLSPSGGSTTPEKSTYTVEEVLLTALASISCFKSYSNLPQVSNEETDITASIEDLLSCRNSIAYILGTHKDKVSEEEINEFDKELQQSIRSTDFFRDGLVKFSSEHRMVLPIDNMHGRADEIQEVRKFLEEGMKQHFKKLRVPAAWLVLSLCLRKREERTASLQVVLQLAGELGMPEQETKVALWFLHHYAGVLMYFPKLKELIDTVICDTQIVYDSATHLIVNTFKFGQVSMAASERFRETGQFSLEDIRRVTASISGDYIPLMKLVKLLEHLNIIAPVIQSNPTFSQSNPTSSQVSPLQSNVIYFMPCVLQNATHEELDKWWASISNSLSPAPLFFRYKCGYVPIGVFPAMIASLAGQDSIEMIYAGIKKNRVQFLFGGDYDTVTLISQPKYYAIHISRLPNAKTSPYEVCSSVRKLVESTLKTVTSHMNYSFHVEYQLGFECTSHPGREHLCIVKSGETCPRFMCCLANMKSIQPVEIQSQHFIWFEVSNYQPQRLNHSF